MADKPRFMLAQNVLAEPGVEYILHTQKPRILAKINGDNINLVDQYDDVYSAYNGDATKVAGLLRRMADWYVSYKKGKNG